MPGGSQGIPAQVAEAQRQSEELLALANREAMRAEDGLGRMWRLYQSRSQSPFLAKWWENAGENEKIIWGWRDYKQI